MPFHMRFWDVPFHKHIFILKYVSPYARFHMYASHALPRIRPISAHFRRQAGSAFVVHRKGDDLFGMEKKILGKEKKKY